MTADPSSELVAVLRTDDPVAIGLAKGSLDEAVIPFFCFDGIHKHASNFVSPYGLKGWFQAILVPRDREAEARELLVPLQNPEPDPKPAA